MEAPSFDVLKIGQDIDISVFDQLCDDIDKSVSFSNIYSFP